jgi:hypothetical protein
MVTKVCNKCGDEKELDEFGILTSSKDGHKSTCKECRSKEDLKWRLENIEKYRESKRNWGYKNPDKLKATSKNYYENNKGKINKYLKRYREENKEIIKERVKKSILKKPDKYKDDKIKWVKENPQKVKAQWKRHYLKSGKENGRKYYNKNRDICIKRSIKYQMNRRKTDNLFKLKHRISCIISSLIKRNGYIKKSTTYEILGCSYDEFKLHLESKFEPWMSWKNYGKWNGELNYGWDIDHIIPSSSGKTEDEIIKLNHYTNLQPLCSQVNRYIKKEKVDY